MRKVRDYDAELKALGEKARALKARKIEQLGGLVSTTGADIFDPEMLAGILLQAVASEDSATREAWRATGAAFFQRRARKSVTSIAEGPASAIPEDGGRGAPDPDSDTAGRDRPATLV